MDYHVTDAHHVKDYKVFVAFNDGVTGEVDLSECVEAGGIFAPLADIDYFKTLRYDADIETIVWRNGADVAPEYLRQKLQK